MKSLVVKESGTSSRRRKTLRWTEEEDLTWKHILDKVEEEFSVHKQNIQLSLNHGKTFIESTHNTKLSELGIVNGDIITLVHKVDTGQPTTDMQASDTTLSALRPDKVASEDGHSHARTSAEIESEETVVPDPDMVNRFLRLPVLLRDVVDEKLPPSFQELLQEQSTASPLDQLVLAVHTLLLESGFVFSTQSNDLLLSQIHQSPSMYKMAYCHVFHEDSKVTIACVPMGNQLVVHAVVRPAGNQNLTLSTKQFVSEDGLLKDKLVQLSNYVKDLLAAPLILAMKEAMNMPALPAVLDIPYELTIGLLSKLDYRSVCMLGCTCKQLSRVYKDNSIWRRLYIQRYGAPHTTGTRQDICWYNRYKERSLRRRFVRVPQMDTFPSFPSFPFHNPFSPAAPYLPAPIGDDPANRGLPHPHASPSVRQDNSTLGLRPPRRNPFSMRTF